MFIIEFILFPLLYALLMVGVISLGSYMKHLQVPELTTDRYNSTEYTLKLNKKQKKIVDKWEAIQVFSFAWPIEAIIAFVWFICSNIKGGVEYVIGQSSKRAEQAKNRKITELLESKKSELVAKAENGDLNWEQKSLLKSLDGLIAQHDVPVRKALTSK